MNKEEERSQMAALERALFDRMFEGLRILSPYALSAYGLGALSTFDERRVGRIQLTVPIEEETRTMSDEEKQQLRALRWRFTDDGTSSWWGTWVLDID